MRQTITAVIPALHEEKNIRRCIDSLKWCDKIQVLWMGDDNTGEIAALLGADVKKINTGKDGNFIAVQKNINWAIDHSTTDWILRIDADEAVTPELKKEILSILTLEQNDNVAYGIPRKQYFWGGFLKGGDWAYDRLIRLFRPTTARYEPIVEVHEQFQVNGPTSYLHHALLHYSHPTLETAIKKFDLYTSLEVKQLHDSYLSAVYKMLFLPIYIFLRWMIWHHGYRDGLRGIVAAAFRAWYDFLLYSKYLELKFIQKKGNK